MFLPFPLISNGKMHIYLLIVVHFQIIIRNNNNNYVFYVNKIIIDQVTFQDDFHNYIKIVYYFKNSFQHQDFLSTLCFLLNQLINYLELAILLSTNKQISIHKVNNTFY